MVVDVAVGCSEQNSSSHGYAKCRLPAAIHTLERPTHESPNFRKPFYLVEPHRHLGPPRNPNNNNDEDEEDEDEDEEDDNKREPAVIREPDEDE